VAGVAAYRGTFTSAQAERLLWRAGFGPRPGETKALAEKGLEAAVRSLTRPGAEKLLGPAPKDDKGRALAPYDAWGHDHLWWLDRMVRTSRPLVERMTLVWHDWFATSNDGVGSQKLMLQQNAMLRRNSLGSFETLLLEVTRDPAMLLWLNGNDNSRWQPNENYGRELMELFTLGAGRGYAERDVREQARALTGFRNDWKSGVGDANFRYDAKFHDAASKTIFGKRGRWTWQDACRLCLRHPNHPAFFVRKLWSYFIPTAPDAATQRALERLYAGKGRAVAPVVEAILMHPALYEGPRMVLPPAVYNAGLLRRVGRTIDTTSWTWLGAMSGQQLFHPPNVAGWDETRWLDTATFRGRFHIATDVLRPLALDPATNSGKLPNDPQALLDQAVTFWGEPSLNDGTRRALLQFAQDALGDARGSSWKRKQYPVLVQNALRHLIATSPDFLTA
jgi:uncharacterized protein (DUF1800 family)